MTTYILLALLLYPASNDKPAHYYFLNAGTMKQCTEQTEAYYTAQLNGTLSTAKLIGVRCIKYGSDI